MSFKIGHVKVGLNEPLFVIAGPCVLTTVKEAVSIAKKISKIQKNTGVGFIFKASYDKANRSQQYSYRGPGLQKARKIFRIVREETGLPITTDVHHVSMVHSIAEIVDCIQIPAFLCRQTDLIVKAASYNKPVNIKKGQFMSPAAMSGVYDKVFQCHEKILFTERGTFFGYNRLVNDMTGIKIMHDMFDVPVVFDATHSTQQQGNSVETEGRPEFTPLLAKAAMAAGANGLFLEVHPSPADSKCDAGCIYPLDNLEKLIDQCNLIFNIVR